MADLRYPIVYVRGFGGGGSGIDDAADDPFYGFNAGATHIRVGGDGQPQFYQFEGPLVRLVEDEGYRVLVRGGQQAYLERAQTQSLKPNSIWIYRFYDAAASTFGRDRVPFDLPTAADLLLPFVRLVLDRTGAERVYLVAHSMGGLICRSMLQRTCPENGVDGRQIVDKLFTFGTPHNGIEFSIGPVNIPVPEIAPVGAEIFNRDVMYQYLTPSDQRGGDRPDGWDAHVVDPAVFDPTRIFCVIGTDPQDYGMVSKVVGPKSDGLVQIDNAYVRNAPRAFVHRAHSGRYGEVNSEEGYQNLRRFLVGSRKVTVTLIGAELPPATGDGVSDVWQAEAKVSIRGLPILITDQQAAHFCPVQLGTVDGHGGAAQSVPVPPTALATVFLLDPERQRQMAQDNLTPDTPPSPRARYSLALRILHLRQRDGFLFFRDHLETTPEWSDHLVVDVGPLPGEETGEHLWAAWESQLATVTSETDPICDVAQEPVAAAGGGLTFDIPLPTNTNAGCCLFNGGHTAVRLVVEPWQ